MIRVVRICGLTQIVYDLRVYFSRFSVFIRYFHLKRNIRTALPVLPFRTVPLRRRWSFDMSSVFPFSPHSPVQSDLLYKTMRRLYLHAVSQTLSLRRTHLPHTSSGYLQIHCFIYRAVFHCSVNIRLCHPLPESTERMLPPIQIIIDVRTIFIIAQAFLLRRYHVLFFRWSFRNRSIRCIRTVLRVCLIRRLPVLPYSIVFRRLPVLPILF